MSLDKDVAELIAQQRGDVVKPPVFPVWDGNLARWKAVCALYWPAKEHEKWSHWFDLLHRKDPPPTSDEMQAGIKRLEDEGRALAEEHVIALSPFMVPLARRWTDPAPDAVHLLGTPGEWEKVIADDGKYVGANTGMEATAKEMALGWRYSIAPTLDFGVGAHFSRLRPTTALGKDKKPITGLGFSVSPPIGVYAENKLDQVYYLAHEGYHMYQDAERLLTVIGSEKALEAETLCDTWKTYEPPSVQGGRALPMLGMPDGYWELACAYLRGKLDDHQYQAAAHWLTLEHLRPLAGEPDKPMPWHDGWTPLFDDPNWRMGPATLSEFWNYTGKGANVRGKPPHKEKPHRTQKED